MLRCGLQVLIQVDPVSRDRSLPSPRFTQHAVSERLKLVSFNLPLSSTLPESLQPTRIMKSPRVGISLVFLVALQNFHLASTIPYGWLRNNGTNHKTNWELLPPSDGNASDLTGEWVSEGSSANEGHAFGSIYISETAETEQNPKSEQILPFREGPVDNDTFLPFREGLVGNATFEGSSDGPPGQTPPTSIPVFFNYSDLSADFSETQMHGSSLNTSTLEPGHTHQYANDTQNSPIAVTSGDGSGSGHFPLDELPSNSTNLTSTAEDAEIQYRTTILPSESPVYTSTSPMTSASTPEDVTAVASDREGAVKENLTGPLDTRGFFEKDSPTGSITGSKSPQPWVIILVVGIFVGVIALTAFVYLNRRNTKDFSHRKLVEERSPDPVLRLDNSEPLDLKGYYNPGLQQDNIQMTNFPPGHSK